MVSAVSDISTPSRPYDRPFDHGNKNTKKLSRREPKAAYPPLELLGTDGPFMVYPQAPKPLRFSHWQQAAAIMQATATAGIGLLAFGIARGLGFSAWTSSSTTDFQQTAQVGRRDFLMAGAMAVGSAAVSAAGIFNLMLPERKSGPRGNETDPRLLPRFDFHCSWMQTTKAPRAKNGQGLNPVPRIIHQAWFGDSAQLKDRDAAWRSFARTFGYEYKLWTENNLHELEIGENNRRIINYELNTGDFWCVSDIVRYAALSQHGGIYIDVDMNPPHDKHGPVDLSVFINPCGITLLTEEFGRDSGAHNGVFVMNGFISSPRMSELMVHARDTLYINWAAVNRHSRAETTAGGVAMCHAMFASGPFFLNRILSGTPQILPFSDACEIGLIDGTIQ